MYTLKPGTILGYLTEECKPFHVTPVKAYNKCPNKKERYTRVFRVFDSPEKDLYHYTAGIILSNGQELESPPLLKLERDIDNMDCIFTFGTLCLEQSITVVGMFILDEMRYEVTTHHHDKPYSRRRLQKLSGMFDLSMT